MKTHGNGSADTTTAELAEDRTRLRPRGRGGPPDRDCQEPGCLATARFVWSLIFGDGDRRACYGCARDRARQMLEKTRAFRVRPYGRVVA